MPRVEYQHQRPYRGLLSILQARHVPAPQPDGPGTRRQMLDHLEALDDELEHDQPMRTNTMTGLALAQDSSPRRALSTAIPKA